MNMITNEDLKFFEEYKEICAAYQLAGSTLYFDLATAAPKAGVPYRNKMLAVLSGEAFSYQMKPEHLKRLEDMYQNAGEESELKKELEDMAGARETMRKKRTQSKIPKVALVGYTNAGKSTILNRMVDLYGDNKEKKVMEKDMLFATLDTSVRCIYPKADTMENMPFFLTDTVGFIHKLPHGLVKAFRSTLEEVKYADLLIQVVDFSDEHHKQHMEVTAVTLKELGAGDIPQIIVYNKADKCAMETLPRKRDRQIYMAASEGCGIEELTEMIKECVYAGRVEAALLLPYDKGGIVSYFMENATVLEQEYREEGVWIKVSCHRSDADKYAEYCQDI